MSAKIDLTLYQGDTYQHLFTWQNAEAAPIDITGYSARLQMRKSAKSADVLFESTDADGDITLGNTAGTVQLNLPSAKTSLLSPGNQVYDLELTAPDGTVTTLVYGSVAVMAEVTR